MLPLAGLTEARPVAGSLTPSCGSAGPPPVPCVSWGPTPGKQHCDRVHEAAWHTGHAEVTQGPEDACSGLRAAGWTARTSPHRQRQAGLGDQATGAASRRGLPGGRGAGLPEHVERQHKWPLKGQADVLRREDEPGGTFPSVQSRSSPAPAPGTRPAQLRTAVPDHRPGLSASKAHGSTASSRPGPSRGGIFQKENVLPKGLCER